MNPWQLPGPARWRRSMIERIEDGASVVAVIPRHGPQQLGLELVDTLIDARWRCRRLEASELRLGEPQEGAGAAQAAIAVGHALGLTAIEAPGLARECDGEVLVIDATARPPREQAAVCALAAAVATAEKVEQPSRRTRLVVIAGTTAAEPAADPGSLEIMRWWGVIEPLDALLAATELSDGRHDPAVMAAVAELAGWDLATLAQLAEWDGRLSSLATHVDEVVRTGVPGEAPLELSAVTEAPTGPLATAWAGGRIDAWRGWALPHLTAVRDPMAEANRRVWQAQVGVLFGDVEIERARLVAWLEREEQSARLQRRQEWTDRAIDELEPGALHAFVLAHRRLRISERRLALIEQLKQLRNDLAHRTPIDISRIQRFRSAVHADRRTEAQQTGAP